MEKPLNSPAPFRPISLTSCVSKIFQHVIPSRLLFFLGSNSILFPRQAAFRRGRSTLNQIFYLSHFISDGFNKLKRGSWTILATHVFSKAFDSVWNPLFSTDSFRRASLLVLLVELNPFFDRRACVVYHNHKSRSFGVCRGVLQGSVLGPVLFSLFINDLPASLPSSVSYSLYADDLDIWSSSTSVPAVVGAIQGALIRLESWSEYWCITLNLSKCEASFFSVDPHQANLQPHLFLFNCPLRFNPTPIFLGSPSTVLFSFLNMYLCLRPSSSLVSRSNAVSLLPHGAPLRSPSLFCRKPFFGSLFLLQPDGFLF